MICLEEIYHKRTDPERRETTWSIEDDYLLRLFGNDIGRKEWGQYPFEVLVWDEYTIIGSEDEYLICGDM